MQDIAYIHYILTLSKAQSQLWTAANTPAHIHAHVRLFRLMPGRVCERMRLSCFCMCVTWLAPVPVSSYMCVRTSLCAGVQDSFVVGFSLTSGHVLYASEQAPSILCCKRKFLESAKFVELLFHQDVNVFYSHTAQPHLPPWSNSHTGLHHIFWN